MMQITSVIHQRNSPSSDECVHCGGPRNVKIAEVGEDFPLLCLAFDIKPIRVKIRL